MTTMSDMFAKRDYKSMTAEGLCCVEVSGESCAGCAALLPVLQPIAERMGMHFVHAEAALAGEELLAEWKIDRVPTVLLCDGGEIFARCAGFQPEEILEIWIEAKLEEHRAGKR